MNDVLASLAVIWAMCAAGGVLHVCLLFLYFRRLDGGRSASKRARRDALRQRYRDRQKMTVDKEDGGGGG